MTNVLLIRGIQTQTRHAGGKAVHVKTEAEPAEMQH